MINGCSVNFSLCEYFIQEKRSRLIKFSFSMLYCVTEKYFQEYNIIE